MERKYSIEQIEQGLASQKDSEVREARKELQKRLEDKDQQAIEAIKVAIFVDNPADLVEVPLNKKEEKPMLTAVKAQQTKLRETGDRFSQELAALGGPDLAGVKRKIEFLYTGMNNAMRALIKGRADLAVARPTERLSVQSVRDQILAQLEMSQTLKQVKDYSLLHKADWDGVVANLPTAEFSDAVAIDAKRDLELLLEKEKNPASVVSKALELAEAAAKKHDKLIIYVLGSQLMAHTFARLAGEQAEELKKKLFDVLAKSYPETLAISYWPIITSDISDCQKLWKMEMAELKKVGNDDED